MSDEADSAEPFGWRPARPCHEEVSEAIREIKAALTDQQMFHAVVQDEDENWDFWSVSCRDDDGYVNVGMLSWSPELGRVVFAAYDPLRARHDAAEGIPEDGSACWWSPQTATQMIMHLDGTVREIVAADRAAAVRRLAEDEAAAA